MIIFEKEITVPGDLGEVSDRLGCGQSQPGHNDFCINLVLLWRLQPVDDGVKVQ